MKISTNISAALMALGIVYQTGAQTVVYLTGSTAFRSTTYSALNANGTNNGGVFDATPQSVTYGSGTASSANYMVFSGNIGGNPVIINCAWSGSEAGIASACNTSLGNTDKNGNPIPLAGSPETWVDATKVTYGQTVSTNPPASLLESSSHGSDLAMADTSQAVSWTPFVANTSTALKDYGTAGIVAFTFCKNVNTSPDAAWLSFTNITLPQFIVELAHGYEFPAFFTGNASQTNEFVYLVGRNLGSGTRMNELADSGYGTHKSVTQFSIGEGVEITPQTTSLTLDYENNNGYESGGGVATALGINGSCQQADPFFPSNPAWFAMGFLGISDALSHGLAVSPNWLTVDGVLESNGAIEQGQYWAWGHEHVYGKNGISGIQDTVGNALFAGLQRNLNILGLGSNPAAHDNGIALQYMQCSKASDTAFPTR